MVSHLLARLVGAALDLALPPRCLGCGARDCWLCSTCSAGLPRLASGRCRVCAAPLTGVAVCPACYRRPPKFDRVDAPFRHDGLARELVHALKYRGQRHLAPLLASSMATALASAAEAPVDEPTSLEEQAEALVFDLVVPVPLHATRRAERGFNQSELLAERVAAHLHARVDPAALRRERKTQPQVDLAPKDRAANVRGAFAATRRFEGARLLLVDDVCTTGATLDACAAVLKAAGARRVGCVVATRASTTPL